MSQAVLTPTAGRVMRRSLFWVGVAAFLAVVVLLTFGAIGSQSDGGYLDPESPSPSGTRALVEVLRQQGVDATATTSLADTRDAVSDPADTTLVLYDAAGYLTADQLRQAQGLAAVTVLLEPSFDQLQALAPEVALAGTSGTSLDASCDLPAARKAGTITTADGSGYRVVDTSADATQCFRTGDDVYSLVQLDRGGSTLVVLGASSALTNEHIIEKGNAALALNLLGSTHDLVWYLPSFADLPQDAPQDLGALTPAWVSPVLGLLVITFLVGAVWRGRRLGPLVVENLPVTVRASETMLGRARLYEKSSARLRALDALRIGSVQRLAVLCGLPRTATVEDVIVAVAAATGTDSSGIRALIIGTEPTSDGELVALSDALLELERSVAAAVRP